MIYRTLAGREVDTERALGQAARHVLQKLFCFENLGMDPAAFAEKRAQALAKGWNGGGPLEESGPLGEVADDLADRLAARAGQAAGPGWLKAQIYAGRYNGGGFRPLEQGGGVSRVEILDAADLVVGVGEVVLSGEQSAAQALASAVSRAREGRGPLALALAACTLELRD